MLDATVVSLKRQGKENVKHNPAIENEDLVRLKSSQVFFLFFLFFFYLSIIFLFT